MTKAKIGLISGSTRKQSINRHLVTAMVHVFKDLGADPHIIDLKDYDMPIYNGDYEEANGVPEAVGRLVAAMGDCDGVFIATPEYNGCLPALLKNSIDWSTRLGLAHFEEPVYGIGAATPGGLSGIMALRQLHFILARLGARVIAPELGVGFAAKAFDEEGRFVDARLNARAEKLARQMLGTIASTAKG